MSLKPETIAQIQTLLQTDPVLLAEVQSSEKLSETVASLAKIAAARGIEISASDLLAHFETIARQTMVSDAELEQLAGGLVQLADSLVSGPDGNFYGSSCANGTHGGGDHFDISDIGSSGLRSSPRQ